MARSKSDISNSAIRIFLQKVGSFYDEARGLDPFKPKKPQSMELLEFFNYQCCYCHTELTIKSYSQDHLIPMNKASLGLHAWGNVVPCCNICNNSKQQKYWVDFLKEKSDENEYYARKRKILKFIELKRYDPSLNLHNYADNLYEDVGAIALTLIDLRYKQAESAIQELLGDDKNNFNESKFTDSSDILDRKLRSIGKKVFVEQYTLLKDYANGLLEHDYCQQHLIDSNVSNAAGSNIRLGNAKYIFQNNLQEEALKNIVNSTKLSESTVNKAKLLLEI